ncbi:helix-turn-helix domain-containing protein [Spongiactinospora rosea]|nr:helix-turn-helix transcriptional regulator [Spongiactinospora rosea]
MSKGTTPTTIGVNGFALRELRVRSGWDTKPFAATIGISRPYLVRIELGERQRVSPSVFAAMLRALQLKDRRAILADPHGVATDGDIATDDEALSA